MSILVSDLIASSMRKLEILAAGETPSTDESADGLASLNALLDQWNAEQAMIFQILNFTNVLTSGLQAYTIGLTGCTFTYVNPVKIESAGIITPNGLRHEMTIVGAEDWAKIEEKSLYGQLPKVLYFDSGWPNGTINIWPIYSIGSAPTLDLYIWRQLSAFGATTSVVNLPPAYYKALVYGLAMDIAPEYGAKAITASQSIAGTAEEAKQVILTLNESNKFGREPSAIPEPAAAPMQGKQ